MNNKFIKRVAAVVLGVAVLSTCAFASTIEGTSSYSDPTLSFSYKSAADKVSYIAYAATEAADGSYTLGNIVAIGQADNNTADEVVPVRVDISESLLGDATHIVIKSGDSAGTTVDQDVVLAVEEFETAMSATSTGTHTVTMGGVTYNDVPTFKVSFKNNVRGTATVTGFTAKAPGKEDHTIEGSNISKAITYSGTGSMEIENIYLVGAPADYIAAGITLVPEISFVK